MKKRLSIFIFSLLVSSSSLLAEQWEIKKRVEPRYPIKAIKSNQEGCVKLQYFINADGVPVYIEPIKSSTTDIFDNAAVKALSQWRYKPTKSNPDSLSERQTVQLTFAISQDSDITNKCYANMTTEPSDIKLFREVRLSTPIVANDLVSWKSSIKKITTVLSSTEIDNFYQSYSSLSNNNSGSPQDKLNSLLTTVNGLNYHQIITLANTATHEKSATSAQANKPEPQMNANKHPLINMQQFFRSWEISDLAIAIESNLYKEISYHQLKIELLINSDGTAKLLSTCRAVSDEMQIALQESISDWEITNKVKSPKTVRFIYGVPAPTEAGSYYQCDDNWHPEHHLQHNHDQ